MARRGRGGLARETRNRLNNPPGEGDRECPKASSGAASALIARDQIYSNDIFIFISLYVSKLNEYVYRHVNRGMRRFYPGRLSLSLCGYMERIWIIDRDDDGNRDREDLLGNYCIHVSIS